MPSNYFYTAYAQPAGVTDVSKFISNGQCYKDLPSLNNWLEFIFDNSFTYKNILQKLGETKESEIANILVSLFLHDYMLRLPYIFDSEILDTDTEEEKKRKNLNKIEKEKRIKNIVRMLECIKYNSCIIQQLPDICRKASIAEDRMLDGGISEGVYEPCINVIIGSVESEEEETNNEFVNA